MARNENELLQAIDGDNAGWFVYYDENNSTTTYEYNTDWTTKAYNWEINNVGASDLTVEINDSGFVFTVDAGKGFGSLSHKEGINKVVVTATDDYRLLIRE